MLIRIIGGLMICASSALIGFYLGERGKRRLTELTEFKKSLNVLKAEMEFAKHPLEVAFANTAENTTGATQTFYESAARLLISGTSAADAWQQSALHLKSSSLAAEDAESLSRISSVFTAMDKGAREAAFKMAVDYIDAKTQFLVPENIKMQKMYRGLGILCGLLIVVTLL